MSKPDLIGKEISGREYQVCSECEHTLAFCECEDDDCDYCCGYDCQHDECYYGNYYDTDGENLDEE